MVCVVMTRVMDLLMCRSLAAPTLAARPLSCVHHVVTVVVLFAVIVVVVIDVGYLLFLLLAVEV